MMRRKVLVLDLDETLIHSHHDGVLRQVKPGTPPDFVLKVTIDRHPVRFFVHKRPHVDFFLEVKRFIPLRNMRHPPVSMKAVKDYLYNDLQSFKNSEGQWKLLEPESGE
ncbi:CTD nuclear envelope phosphatase 1 [Elysia marginata]|uniref:CTD nuclear envelope phosphatase 1 n=1 Tax=Elysia marginata TaxID=1093978 RepID=A0AAV4IWM1_9GAST|nr:CTD nuclear envelope phosphatase 1 [Elysia marginata]